MQQEEITWFGLHSCASGEVHYLGAENLQELGTCEGKLSRRLWEDPGLWSECLGFAQKLKQRSSAGCRAVLLWAQADWDSIGFAVHQCSCVLVC